MASCTTYWRRYHARLPQRGTFDPETQVPVFISSVQKHENTLWVKLTVLRGGADSQQITWDAKLEHVCLPLLFSLVSWEACQHLKPSGVVYYNDVISTMGESFASVPMTVFDGDNKEVVDVQPLVFTNPNDLKSARDTLLGMNARVFSFTRKYNQMDANALALLNLISLSCYGLRKELVGQPTLKLTDLILDEELDAKTFASNHHDVYKTPYVQAAFDIECLVRHESSSQYKPHEPNSYRSQTYRNYKSLKERYPDAHAFCWALNIALPQISISLLDPGEITSISLVVADRKPKTKMVFYNSLLCRHKPLEKEGDAFRFVKCENEYHLIIAFLKAIRHVNILYVFNAEFDVGTLHARILYWQKKSNAADAGAMRSAWQQFACKSSTALQQTMSFANDKVVKSYSNVISVVEQNMKLYWDKKNKCLTEPVDFAKVRQLRGVISRHSEECRKRPHFSFNCFGAHIVDLYQVCYSYDINFNAGNRSLDAISRYLIPKHFPRKDPAKCCKASDVRYSEMDEMYTKGSPQELRSYLLYNLTDSELLMRLARTQNVVPSFVNRVRASMNIDCLNTGRGDMYFNGFVQTTKLSTMPLLKARVVNNIVCALGDAAETACFPQEFKRLAEKMKLDGGYVVPPITGLSFAGRENSVELTVDFSSLYPSNMVDACISPDAIINSTHAPRFSGWVLFDWRKIEPRFNCYTLMFNPKGKRHVTTTTFALNNYLAMRKHYKKLMAEATAPEAKDFYNQLQGEMKLAANSQYGVAHEACKHLITGLGRFKIKAVIRHLEKTRHLVNYGDTDSVMCHLPPEQAALYEGQDDVDSTETPLGGWLEERLSEAKGCVARQFENFTPTLKYIDWVLEDEMLNCLCYVDDNGHLLPFNKHPEAEGIREEYRKTSISKLSFENYSSVITRLNKKMYICTTHEPEGNDPFALTSVKMKGLVANKSSSSGAARRITQMYIDLVCKGHALSLVNDFDRMRSKLWHLLRPGDLTVVGSETRMVKKASCLTDRTGQYYGVQVDYEEGSVRVITTKDGVNLTHMVSVKEQKRRCASYVKYSIFESYSNNAALNTDWHNSIKYIKPSNANSAHLKTNRALVGLRVPSEGKIPYVDLVPAPNSVYKIQRCAAKTKQLNARFVHQDCAAAFLGHYYINMNMDFVPYMFGQKVSVTNADNAVRQADSVTKHTLSSRSWIKMCAHHEVTGKYVSNFLVHVMVEECCDLGKEPTTKDRRLFTLKAAEYYKRVLKEMQEMGSKGTGLFTSVFNEMPKDMKGPCGLMDYFITSPPCVLPKELYGDLDPTSKCDNYLNMLGALSKLMEMKLVVPTRTPHGDRIAVHLGCSKKHASTVLHDLGIESEYKTLCVSTENTDHPEIINAARLIYLDLLFSPKKERGEEQCKPTSLGEPPATATASELKGWVERHGDLIESWSSERTPGANKVRLHCAGCATYWKKEKDVTQMVVEDYSREGSLYVRKRKVICLKNMTEDENGCC